MSDYQRFLFDSKKGKFLGEFEEMYQAEQTDGFDSWQQEDMRNLARQFLLVLLNEYQFGNIVDLGCGKGTLTHLLKKRNNHCIALDVSMTALAKARLRYPDIDFRQTDLNNLDQLKDFFESQPQKIDLVFSSETFSYLFRWKDVLKLISTQTEYFLICLQIADESMSYVDSHEELVSEIEKSFDLVETIRMVQSEYSIILARSKA